MLIRLRDVVRDLGRNQIRGPSPFLGRDAVAHLGHGDSPLGGDLYSSCYSGAGRERRGYRAAGGSCRDGWERRERRDMRKKRRGIRARWARAVARASLLRIDHEDRRQRNGGDGGHRGGHSVRRCDWKRRIRRHKRRGGNRRRQDRSLTRRTARGGLGIEVRVGLRIGLVWSLALLRHRLMLWPERPLAGIRRAKRSLSSRLCDGRAWAGMSRDGWMRARMRRSHLGAGDGSNQR